MPIKSQRYFVSMTMHAWKSTNTVNLVRDKAQGQGYGCMHPENCRVRGMDSNCIQNFIRMNTDCSQFSALLIVPAPFSLGILCWGRKIRCIKKHIIMITLDSLELILFQARQQLSSRRNEDRWSLIIAFNEKER